MELITVIGASRNRPEKMADVIENWSKKAYDKSRIDFVVSLDDNDEKLELYKKLLDRKSKDLDVKINLLVNENKNTVQAINRCKSYISGDLIIVFSDDTDCPENWDEALLKIDKKGLEDFIIKTRDGISEDLITMPIFSKSYLIKKEYIYNPIYSHMFCDTELTSVSHMEEVVIESNNLFFNHLHYSQGDREKDYIDDKNQETFYTGMDLFKNRYRIYFGLNKEKMEKIPLSIKEWIKENTNSQED
jgi:hypothetical protein